MSPLAFSLSGDSRGLSLCPGGVGDGAGRWRQGQTLKCSAHIFSSGGFGGSCSGSSRCPGFSRLGPILPFRGSGFRGVLASRTQRDPPGSGLAGQPQNPAFLISQGPCITSEIPISKGPLDREFSACKFNLSTSAFLPRTFPLCLFKKSLPWGGEKKIVSNP